MSLNISPVEGQAVAVGDRIIVSDMNFGEQVTASGLVLTSDDGKTRGIYPRWGRVYSKGPQNKDPYQVGDWILVEHARWSRAYRVKNNDAEMELRTVDPKGVIGYSDVKPSDVNIAR